MIEGSLGGYLLYVAMILAPGFALSQVLGFDRKAESITSRLGYAVGFGLSVDTAVLAIQTSGIYLGAFRLVGFGVWTPYLLVVLGVLLIAASFLLNRRGLSLPHVTRSDIVVLIIAVILAGLAVEHFLKYPIFPGLGAETNPDFTRHVRTAVALQNGSEATIPRQILYGGVSYQLGSSFLLTGGEEIAVAQRIMAVLLVLSLPVVYMAAHKVFRSARASVLSVGIYAGSGVFWFPTLYFAGLYANFFGAIITLFLLVLFLDTVDGTGSRKEWFAFVVVIVAAYFSHFTALTIFPAFLAFALLLLLRRGTASKRALVAAFVCFVPGLMGAAIFRSQVARALKLSYEGGGNVPLSTQLSSILSPFPALSYLVSLIFDDAVALALLVLLAFAVYFAARRKDLRIALPLAWFVILFAAAPFGVSAWRFSLEATIPLTLLAGYGAHSLIPQKRAGKKRRLSSGDPYWFVVLGVIVILVLPTMVGSLAWQAAADGANGTWVNAKDQGYVYSAITWLGSNTPGNSTYLAVTEPLFEYTDLMLGRAGYFTPISTPQQAGAYAKSHGYGYVIVTMNSSVPIFNSAANRIWAIFTQPTSMTLVYSSPDVKVFKVN